MNSSLKEKIESKDLNEGEDNANPRQNFTCDKCGFNATSLAILVKHKTNEHNPVLSCDR